MSIPITNGTGQSSVAAEAVAGLQYQQVEIYGAGAASVLQINPDGSLRASILGIPNVNASGSVVTFQAGLVMASVSGVYGPGGSVLTINPDGSMRASIWGIPTVQLNGTPTVNVGNPQSSVFAISVGSVITIAQAPSIVGTYAEDAGHTSGDKGVFALNVRNDTMASVTSNDGDYGALSLGPSGEAIVANAPITKWVRGTADLRVVLGSSVTAVAAQGTSVFTYITSAQIANMGPASVLVTFTGGLGSILGYSVAPVGGGSNILYPNALRTGENSAFAASISGTASVLISVQGFTAKV